MRMNLYLRTTTVAVAVAFALDAAAIDPAGAQAPLVIQSPAFKDGTRIPTEHTADGADLSPPLTWSNVSPQAKELALIVDDPDAARPKPWAHWVIYHVPPSARGLPRGVSRVPHPLEVRGASNGLNSWKTTGYRGPAPPPGGGLHRYRFHLFALDVPLRAEKTLNADELRERMNGHVIAEAEIVGTYSR